MRIAPSVRVNAQYPAFGFVPVNMTVQDGEEVVLDGVRMVFHYAVNDTRDSLIVHFPDLDMVCHNTAVTPMLLSMYTVFDRLKSRQ